ncbi:PI-PLC domain-containing protein [Vibrio sp. VNB-15]
MVDIIAHRGVWNKVSEQNTEEAFKLAFINDFGIETDLRDFDGKIVISHDMPSKDNMTVTKFFDLSLSNPHVTLALNIKADGLVEILNKIDIKNPHFYFDMSVPDMLHYYKNKKPFYTRYSDMELTPSLYQESQGIWLDNFRDDSLALDTLSQFLIDGKKVVLVSPELHKRNESKYWGDLKSFLVNNQRFANNVGLCTDFPFKAREYFNGE